MSSRDLQRAMLVFLLAAGGCKPPQFWEVGGARKEPGPGGGVEPLPAEGVGPVERMRPESGLEPPPPRQPGRRWTMVAAGDSHTCAVAEDGTLWCWGRPFGGPLGLGDETPRREPARVGEAADWISVSAGSEHTCGIRERGRGRGELYCWGKSRGGRLGVPNRAVRDLPASRSRGASAPARVGRASDWIAVSAGALHTCGIRAGGRLYCWGSGAVGWDKGDSSLGHGGTEAAARLGLGGTGPRWNPAQVERWADWTAVSAGSHHTCGIREGGALYCWGAGGGGALGVGDAEERSRPTRVGVDDGWVTVSAGMSARAEGARTCALREDGSLHCWGALLADAGRRDRRDVRHRPVRVGEGTRWSSVTTGHRHTCATGEDGTLACFGHGGRGLLGMGDGDSRVALTRVGGEADWQSVSAGTRHTCGTRTDGSLHCWGENRDGALGLGHPRRSRNPEDDVEPEPVKMTLDAPLRQISAGGSGGCGVAFDGTLWCWDGGRIFPRRFSEKTDWLLVSVGGPNLNLPFGDTFACGIRGPGDLYCWGGGKSGQLGVGPERFAPLREMVRERDMARVGGRLPGGQEEAQRRHREWARLRSELTNLPPTRVGSSSDWAFVSTGDSHACGIRGGGALYCWGSGANGELGIGDEEARARLHALLRQTPDPHNFSRPVPDREARQREILEAQDRLDRHRPTRVGPDSDWVAVSAGSIHTCGIRKSGALYCWGYDRYGQLGLGDPDRFERLRVLGAELYEQLHHPTPTRVGAAEDWIAVSARGALTCGIRAAPGDGRLGGTLHCWGSTERYQRRIPRAARTSVPSELPVSTTPMQLDEAEDWTTVSVGGHVHALRADGRAWCWGSPWQRQVSQRLAPAHDAHQTLEPVESAGDWVALSVDWRHAHALTASGRVYSWGRHDRLGNGEVRDVTPRPAQVVVP